MAATATLRRTMVTDITVVRIIMAIVPTIRVGGPCMATATTKNMKPGKSAGLFLLVLFELRTGPITA